MPVYMVVVSTSPTQKEFGSHKGWLIFYTHVIIVFLCSTFLKECPFIIKIRASQDGKKLCIKDVSGQHTHELSKVSHICVCGFEYIHSNIL